MNNCTKRYPLLLLLLLQSSIIQWKASAFSPPISSFSGTVSAVPKQQQHLSRPMRYYHNSNTNTQFKQATTTTTSTRRTTSLHSTAALTTTGSSSAAWISMTLLAIQFATQPILTKRFTPPNINRNKVVIGQEVFKFVLAWGMLQLTGSYASAVAGWTVPSWIVVAIVPALFYSLQGILKLVAYQHLDGFTFNVLNQTKTLASALCCFLVMGQRQSPLQIAALVLLFASACIMEGVMPLKVPTFLKRTNKNNNIIDSVVVEDDDNNNTKAKAVASSSSKQQKERTKGVVAVLVASFVSGLAGALSQKSLQGHGGRNSYLFTMELSVASSLFLVLNNFFFPRKKEKQLSTSKEKEETSSAFSWKIIIPMLTNAIGGILVGLVTKQVGAVKKGFALIFGLWLSGILQGLDSSSSKSGGGGVTKEQIVGATLASISLWMHMAFKVRQ